MGKRALILAVLAALGVAVLLSVTSRAQVTKGKSRPALTSHIMAGLVQPNCAALSKGLKDKPADDKAWKALATSAALLNEASYLVMDDGRCPDATWANAAKTLRECSAVVLAKIDSKDAAGAQAAFTQLTKACAACHGAHRKAKK
jgi:hypothetical protein